jgi:hypothetical protein
MPGLDVCHWELRLVAFSVHRQDSSDDDLSNLIGSTDGTRASGLGNFQSGFRLLKINIRDTYLNTKPPAKLIRAGVLAGSAPCSVGAPITLAFVETPREVGLRVGFDFK